MKIAEVVPGLRRYAANHRRLVAIVSIAALVVGGSTTAAAVSTQAAAAEHERAEALAAQELEQKFVDYYLCALDRLQPFGAQLVDDATAWATSKSPLLTEDHVVGLESTADAVRDSLS